MGHGENLDDELNKEKDELEKSSNNKEMQLLIKDNDDYSVAQMHETGWLNVFTINLHALFRKRFFMYKRSIKTFITEILIPIILVIIGLAFTKIEFFYNSPERHLNIVQYPFKQRMLANSELVVKAGSPYDIQPS